MKRIMIVGGAGAGKSTLARWLGAQTGLPVHHLDSVFWMRDWTPRPEADKRAIMAQIEGQAAWIIEGNIAETFQNRVARADILIWLDLPVHLRLWRLVRRTLQHRGVARPDLPEGCVQRLDRNTAAFLWDVWRDRHSSRKRFAACCDMAAERVAVHHLTSRPALRNFQQAVQVAS